MYDNREKENKGQTILMAAEIALQNKDSSKNESKEGTLNGGTGQGIEDKDGISERIIQRLVDANHWVLLLIILILSEICTAIMSVILRGEVAYDYLISAGVVSIMVGGALLYFLLEIKQTRLSNIALQNEIFERKQAEDGLEIAHEFLQSAYEDLISLDELKSNLIANVSHELRTPIFIAKGALELVTDTEDEEEKKELLTMADEALVRQNLIIDDLMEASKMERKKRELELAPVDINKVIADVIEPIMPIIEQREIKLDTPVKKNLPKVMANQRQLEHVIRNLLSNAIKFNKKGGQIKVQARRKVDFIELCVADTGVGIEKDNLSNVFDKFFQVDTSTDRTYGGTGMGLAVAKEIIEAHGGRIRVESEPGKGSRFYFKLLISK